ncbi:hypothetical protein J132_00331, partial [Termitomyces sp. J132]
PFYISAHFADVILSEIRPTKLNIEALHSINVFLDEFLFNILKNASSLLTDNLRASLLGLLPTALGKEALLEAEVELRAYWDRTAAPDAGTFVDDSKVFHLQWAFELLRLKCGAYSTLNDSDEDNAAEIRTNDRMTAAGGIPPKAALLAPASLYLTAILEAICEHILSNVSRVVARDSSRTNATAQDLFVALCEDHTIYDLFKKMKVYEQIEQLSKLPKVRRSKSLTRNEKSSRTSSPQQDMSSTKPPAEAPAIATNTGSTAAGITGSRPSFEKTRTMKMFKVNSRSSIDADVPNDHKRSNSSVSEKSSGHTTILMDDSAYENDALRQEFDDLMRSSSTMKVSLTPDRLKTMEVYKQEKESGNRRGPESESENPPPVAPRATGRRPSLLHRVDSIKEDEEESGLKPTPPLPTTRNRQASVSTRPSTAPVSGRVRSVSSSGSSAVSRFFANSSHTSTSLPAPMVVDQSSMQKHRHITNVQGPSLPTHTRRVQRNRESLNLDEVMAGSDDDEVLILAPPPKFSPRPATPRGNGQNVSENTRHLINFLSEGPSGMGGPVSDTANDGPLCGTSNGKLKGTGRLQRMISKLSLGSGDRLRRTDDVSRPSAQAARAIPSQPSLNNLSSLANRPVPPRPPPAPRPISPPESPRDSFEDQSYTDSRSRSISTAERKLHSDSSNQSGPVLVPTIPSSSIQRSGSVSSIRSQSQSQSHENGHIQQFFDVVPPPHAISAQRSDSRSSPIPSQGQWRSQAASSTPPASLNRKPPPVYIDRGTQPHISHEDALHMHRLFSKATTADECRLILDMFLTRTGILDPRQQLNAPHPPFRDQAAAADSRLEASLLELLLGSEPATATRESSIIGSGQPVAASGSSIAQQEAFRFVQNDTMMRA